MRRVKPLYTLCFITINKRQLCGYSVTSRRKPFLKHDLLHPQYQLISKRKLGMFALRIIRGALRVRYLLLGGAVGGGVSLHKKYQEWKSSLPEMDWFDKYKFDSEKLDSFRASLINVTDKLKEIEIDPSIIGSGKERLQSFRDWLNRRITEAYEAAEEDNDSETVGKLVLLKMWVQEKLDQAKMEAENGVEGIGPNDSSLKRALEIFLEGASKKATVNALLFSSGSENNQSRIDTLQKELMEVQLKYQRELDKLEKDNRDLKKQVLLLKNRKGMNNRKAKKSLIDMYSEVLDELSDYDSSYSAQDHLPRVVVVGDQSAGKTSVLEMIANARIFPRGCGEMMTRAPVKVTLSEGPYHIAKFKDSDREFDLSNEDELLKLRAEVEHRMRQSVGRGKTVSKDVISMSVSGPGLQRMVLVDLPGIISTVTKEMAPDTRECIKQMTETYVSNPNAIILCIQDGSVDAERSNVTDLVTAVDPQGKRTILVLTKVDLAEANMTNPDRITKILKGELFPMKALGYFGVVTGQGKKNESIDDIRNYEEDFFRNSKLFRGSLMKQVTTKNLSMAVSECFWKMVRETVEQQADSFKALRYNLETEWKNTFPGVRELDRDELLEKARGEILDQVINLSLMSAQQWEDTLKLSIWQCVKEDVYNRIYYPVISETHNQGEFNTLTDIILKDWIERLSLACVDVGKNSMGKAFKAFINEPSKKSDPIFTPLKEYITSLALNQHQWENKGSEMLRLIQMSTMEDKYVHNKTQWDAAVAFWDNFLKENIKKTSDNLAEQSGPSMVSRWMYWKNSSKDQQLFNATKVILNEIIRQEGHSHVLSKTELISINHALANQGFENVSFDVIAKAWNVVYMNHILQQKREKVKECRKEFYLHQQTQSTAEESDCYDVVFFWRMEQMLMASSKALRQQIMNREAPRFERIIKDILDDISQNHDLKVKLLQGKKVELAETLKKLRILQEKLEEFIQALNKEK